LDERFCAKPVASETASLSWSSGSILPLISVKSAASPKKYAMGSSLPKLV
jgi:hypothetical protein